MPPSRLAILAILAQSLAQTSSPSPGAPGYLERSDCLGGLRRLLPLGQCLLVNGSGLFQRLLLADSSPSALYVSSELFSNGSCGQSLSVTLELLPTSCPGLNASVPYAYSLLTSPPADAVFSVPLYSDGACSLLTGVVEYSPPKDFCPPFGGAVATTCSQDGTYLYLSGLNHSSPTALGCPNGTFFFEAPSNLCAPATDDSGLYQRKLCSPNAAASPSLELNSSQGYLAVTGCDFNRGVASFTPLSLGCFNTSLGSSRRAVATLSNGYSGLASLVYNSSLCRGPSSLRLDQLVANSCSANFSEAFVSALPPPTSALSIDYAYADPSCSTPLSLTYLSQSAVSCVRVKGVNGLVRVEACSQGPFLVVFSAYLFAANDSSCQGPSTRIQYNVTAGCVNAGNSYSRTICPQSSASGTPTIVPSFRPSGRPTGTPTALPTLSGCNHSVCVTGEGLDPLHCDSCVTRVTLKDSYCRYTRWDAICVEEVFYLCGIVCSPTSPASAPAFAPYRKVSKAPSNSYYSYGSYYYGLIASNPSGSYAPSFSPTYSNVSAAAQQGRDLRVPNET